MKHMLWKKEEGSLTEMGMAFILLFFFAFLFAAFFYLRKIEQFAALTEDAVDYSNLSAAFVDLTEFEKDERHFRILTSTDSSMAAATTEEQAQFRARLGLYITALKQNLGADESFAFINGNGRFVKDDLCGKVIIKEFAVYDVMDYTPGTRSDVVKLYAQSISAEGQKDTIAVFKQVYPDAAEIGADKQVSSCSVITPDHVEVKGPVIYSCLGFSIKSPGFSEREYTMDVERKSSADVRKNE